MDNINQDKIKPDGMKKTCTCPNCSEELINNCHSIITDYPIDYNNFPLAKNCQIHKIELYKNQYLMIPTDWYHWVFTEPNTLSIHYDIGNISFIDTNNDFYKSLKYSQPFFKEFNPKNNIKYNDFINKSLNYSYKAIISETDDCIPVQKNQANKFFHSNTLANIIDFNFKSNYHTYIGNNKIDPGNIMNNFTSIDDIIDPKFHNGVSYNPSVWFTLDKRVNSGLHSDAAPNLIHIIDGKKTIYLISPTYINNLYIKGYPLIKTI